MVEVTWFGVRGSGRETALYLRKVFVKCCWEDKESEELTCFPEASPEILAATSSISADFHVTSRHHFDLQQT